MRFLPEARLLLFQSSPALNAFATSCKAHVFPSPHRRFATAETTPATSAFTVHMAQVQKDGSFTHADFSLDDLLQFLRKEKLALPPRDLKILFRSNLEAASSTCIMARPKTKCFLLELEHIKLICLRDKCLVLHPDTPIVSEFIDDLSHKCANPNTTNCANDDKEMKRKGNLKPTVQEFHRLLTNDIQSMDFEHVVLEQVLSNISARFSRHVWLTKPALELLLQQISQDPSGSMLRRLLAFRKSLGEFETGVQQVHRVLETLLMNDEDLVSLYLTNPDRDIKDHQEVELLVEAYSHDLFDIICEIRNMKDMVEETNQFINTHLDTVRNRMIRMSLFMEMGTLSLATGAVIAGVFGMNLLHGAEESPTAFFLTTGAMVALMGAVFGSVVSKYNRLVADTTRAHSFKALKNFFYYVDELDRIVESRGQESLSKSEFREVLCRLTGTKVTDEETDFIFRMFDADKDGKLVKSEVKLGHNWKVRG